MVRNPGPAGKQSRRGGRSSIAVSGSSSPASFAASASDAVSPRIASAATSARASRAASLQLASTCSTTGAGRAARASGRDHTAAGTSSSRASTSRGLPRVCRVRRAAFAGCRVRPRDAASSATAVGIAARRAGSAGHQVAVRRHAGRCRAPPAAATRDGGAPRLQWHAGSRYRRARRHRSRAARGRALQPVDKGRCRGDGFGGDIVLKQLAQHRPASLPPTAACAHRHLGAAR